MSIKYFILDIGDVCYHYSQEPLNMYCKENTTNIELFEKTGGFFSFDYKPFEKGEVSFLQFCKNVCDHCYMKYNRSVAQKINQKMHEGVGNLFSETLEVISYLQQQNIPVCFLSNAFPNIEDATMQKLKNFSFYKCFLSYNIGLIKPNPEIYKYVLKKLGVCVNEVIFIDDKERNTKAAEAVGIKSIIYKQKTIMNDILSIL